jgi:glycosyltransferase involved in cell wall biosynthesis
MKVLHLNHSDSIGGAAKFSQRLHNSILSIGEDSYMCCSSVKLQNERIFRVNPVMPKNLSLLKAKAAQTLDSKVQLLERTNIKSFKSAGWFGAVSADWINRSDFDVINLHWINGGLISIKEIGRIRKPIVWSMLDMWPFLGAEHYTQEIEARGMIEGFNGDNRPENDLGIDVCRISAHLKERYLTEKITYVAPSRWLADRAEQSQRLARAEIRVIPAALDIDLYSPMINHSSVDKTGSSFVIGYGGALSGRKGWELFNKFLNTYDKDLVGSTVIVFGSPISEAFSSPYYEIKQAGRVMDEGMLVSLYREMDVLLFPSTLETFGLIAQEAQSCGVPVICLRNTGTAEVIQHDETGYAINGGAEELISILARLKLDLNLRQLLRINARKRALALWRQDIVAAQYLNLYQTLK